MKTGASFRSIIRDQLRSGATHTEITLNLLEEGNFKVKHKHKYMTPDAVLSMFAAKYPKIAMKHKDALVRASKMTFSAKDVDPKSFSLWALVNAHLYYPEISGKHVAHFEDQKEAESHLNSIFTSISKMLEGKLSSKHMEHISKFTDLVSEHTLKIRSLINKTPFKLKSYTDDPERDLRNLRNNGYVVLLLDGEENKIDPVLLHMAANADEKVFLLVTPLENGNLKVAMRGVNGVISSALYKSLNDEETSVRGNDSFDKWFGTALAGGSPLDGTKIPFPRLSVIFSTYSPKE